MGCQCLVWFSRWVFWSVRSGIQVDIEVNLRQRCDSHSWTVKPQRKQVGEKTSWRTYSKPNLLNSKSIQILFAVKKKNVSFPLEPLLNLQNLAHVSHISFTFSHLNDFKTPHEFETTRSPYGFSKERSPSFLMTQSESTRHTNDSWPRWIKCN